MLLSTLPLALLLLAQETSSAPGLGTEPAAGLGARDVIAAYHLPPLKDQPGDALYKDVQQLQVLARARALHLDEHSATEAWQQAEATLDHAQRVAAEPVPAAPLLFNGTRASQLNVVLARRHTVAVEVQAPEIILDEPIRITHDHTYLNLGSAALHVDAVAPASFGPYLLRIQKVHDVRVLGGFIGPPAGETIAGPPAWAILISAASDVGILHTQISGLSGGGILVTNSSDVTVWANEFHDLRSAPVLLHGNTHRTVVAHSEIIHNLGSSNWQAGIVLTDRNADLVRDPSSLFDAGGYWVPAMPIVQRVTLPTDNVVAFNHIEGNAGSGIYSDGAARNVIVNNRIEGNSKEGTCLDNGSTANIVAYNLYRGNGKRWGKSDADLKRDFIDRFGRLPDGTSPAKVPAISIDNAAFNQVLFNVMDRNYGGGIKMVRTGEYNLIGFNTLTDDNMGRSESFHFFGIELGAAKADVAANDLDFTGSRGNEIFGNTIRGDHYAGIFFADGSDQNVVFDNSIFGATAWAMESVRPQANQTLNNLTNLKLRNISSGLDPTLLPQGAGQFDPPQQKP